MGLLACVIPFLLTEFYVQRVLEVQGVNGYFKVVPIFLVANLITALIYLGLFYKENRFSMYALLPVPISKVVIAHMASYILFWILFFLLTTYVLFLQDFDSVHWYFSSFIPRFLIGLGGYWLLSAGTLLLITNVRGASLLLGLIVLYTVSIFLLVRGGIYLYLGLFTVFNNPYSAYFLLILLFVSYFVFSLKRKSYNRFLAW